MLRMQVGIYPALQGRSLASRNVHASIVMLIFEIVGGILIVLFIAPMLSGGDIVSR
jgi:hypothetical protein